MRPPQELLYESESSLRLVDKAIEELRAESGGSIDISGIDKLQQMHRRLREVSSAAEAATTDMLDGLNRVVSLVEQLDAAATCSDAERHEMAASLRDEVSSLSNHLQFQDITSQQLLYLSALLGDMRTRLADAVALLGSDTEFGGELKDPWTGTPASSQAVADAIFDSRESRKLA
jgi:hypothetical protein